MIPGGYQDFSIVAGLKNNISKQQRSRLAARAGELRMFSPAIFSILLLMTVSKTNGRRILS
jgi:hypothetical protein